MIKIPRVFLSAALSLGFLQAGAAWGEGWSDLSPENQRQLDAGQMVTVVQDVPGHAWPRVKAVQVLKTEAEAAAASFWDFEDSKNTSPGVLESRITRRLSPGEIEVLFVSKIPVLSIEEHSTFRETLTEAGGGAYRISWTLVSARFKLAVPSLSLSWGTIAISFTC